MVRTIQLDNLAEWWLRGKAAPPLQLDNLAEWWLRGKAAPPPAAALEAVHLDAEHDRWHDDGGAPQ